jgi:hypothetical protein
LGSHEFSHFGSQELSHFGSHELSQLAPRSTVWVWPSEFDCVFDCVAVLWFDASTQLPLFWWVSPPLKAARLSPLETNGVERPV